MLLEINGVNVQNMPHNNVAEALKDCPADSAAIFVISRHPFVAQSPMVYGGILAPHRGFIAGMTPNGTYPYRLGESGSNLKVSRICLSEWQFDDALVSKSCGH